MKAQRALLVIVAVLVLPVVGHAQTKIPSGFLGTWAGGGLGANNTPPGAPPIELPYQQLDKKIGEFQQPWAFALHEALEWNTDDSGQACKLDGIFRPGAATGGGGFRFVEAPGKLYQVWGVDERGLHRIYLDSPHPRNVALTWNGDSRGHFEGDDTLVVDMIGFNSKSWLESDRWAHSEELHVIERYRLFGNGDYMQLRVFVDDRLALKTPYTFTRYYRRVPDASEGGEGVCNQNTPEDDLWSQRRNKLLNEHDSAFAAYVAKFANESLPKGPIPAVDPSKAAQTPVPLGTRPPARAATPTVAVAAADSAKLRALAGIYEMIPVSTALPGGLKGAGTLSDLSLLPATTSVASSKTLDLDPAQHCMVVGPFRMMAREGTKFELLTTGEKATLMFENIALGNKREVYLARKEHPKEYEASYLGDSIARFEGDALVVDTVGFNEMTWLNDAGVRHSDALHLVERIRPIQAGRYLEYRVTADDPRTLAKPYTYTRYYQRVNTELQEDFCEDRR
jgi:hypothetical protein